MACNSSKVRAGVEVPAVIRVPAGVARIGSTLEGVEACAREWAGKLVDPAYGFEQFRSWIFKEYPQHEVALEEFSIGRAPITNREYRGYLVESGATVPESVRQQEPDDHPVWGVSLEDARAYAAWLGEATGHAYRLPTELEWEHAARGPSRREYPFGDAFDPRRCNTLESRIGHTTPVTRYPLGASEHGLLDLGGNVEEWTDSVYTPYPGGEVIDDDITRLCGPRYPILRGGSFARGGDLTRCARRHGPHPGPEFRYRGFRIALGTLPRSS